MAVVSVTVPDTLVPKVVAAFKTRYPDLVGRPDAQVGQEAVARILREALQNYEMSRREAEIQGQAATARTDALATISAALAQIV